MLVYLLPFQLKSVEFLLGSTAKIGELIVLGMLTQLKEVINLFTVCTQHAYLTERDNNSVHWLYCVCMLTMQLTDVLNLFTDCIQNACPAERSIILFWLLKLMNKKKQMYLYRRSFPCWVWSYMDLFVLTMHRIYQGQLHLWHIVLYCIYYCIFCSKVSDMFT